MIRNSNLPAYHFGEHIHADTLAELESKASRREDSLSGSGAALCGSWEFEMNARRVPCCTTDSTTSMPEPTEFSIKVTSDDPKKKKEQSEDNAKEGASKLLKDVKEGDKDGEGEELVRTIFIAS